MPTTFDPAPILARRAEFKNFLAARLGGNQADAEDLLQNCLAKILQTSPVINDQEKLVAWFYQVLRHAAVDFIRSHQATVKREETWIREAVELSETEGLREVCRCFEGLLPTLKPVHGELLRRVELQDESVASVAASLGLTTGNASVILYRARQELRRRLAAFCGPCSEKSCFDCDCDPAE